MKYFGRVYSLEIGDGSGFTRTFDGFPSADKAPAQIQFAIDQTPNAERSYGEITIYGLNQKSRNAVYEQFTRVRLTAGYSEAYAVIFDGSIENVEIGRDGPETFVKLYCQSGASIWQSATISKAFGENTPKKDIIRDVAATLGFPVEFVGEFDDLPRALKGFIADGNSVSILRQLRRSVPDNLVGFEWMLTGETLYVVRNNAERPDGETYVYSPTTGLIGSPEITQKGVDIEVLLNPRIRPWDLYTVEAETGRITFNGVYYQGQDFPATNGQGTNKVVSLRHEGDFYGDTWKTSLEGRRL